MHYSTPSLDGVNRISIDEFPVNEGHINKTILVELLTDHILYVGDGKGTDSLDRFWKAVRKEGVKIKYVATNDMAVSIL